MEIILNNGKNLQASLAQIENGVFVMRFINETVDNLKSIFDDSFGTQKIIVREDNKGDATYENYTILDRISLLTGDIYEVELHQKQADTKTKLADNSGQITECQEALEDIYGKIDELNAEIEALKSATVDKEATK